MTTEEQYYDIYLGRVSGLSPFMGDTDLETMANVTIAEYDYEDEAFDNVSQAVMKTEFLAIDWLSQNQSRMGYQNQ